MSDNKVVDYDHLEGEIESTLIGGGIYTPDKKTWLGVQVILNQDRAPNDQYLKIVLNKNNSTENCILSLQSPEFIEFEDMIKLNRDELETVVLYIEENKQVIIDTYKETVEWALDAIKEGYPVNFKITEEYLSNIISIPDYTKLLSEG